MITVCSICRSHFPVLFALMTYHRMYNQVSTTGVTSGAETAYPSGTPMFWCCSCYSIFSFIFCRSLFVLLFFFSRTLFCLTFFDLRTLITPLVSSNSSNVHCRIVFQITSLILNSQEGSCLIYIIDVCLRIIMSITYCAVFVFFLSSSCVLCSQCCHFSGLYILDCLFRFSNVYLYLEYILCFPSTNSAWYRHYVFYFNHHTDLTQKVSIALSNILNYNIISVKLTLLCSRYSRACASYQDFLDIGLLLKMNLLNHRFILTKLKSSLRKFCGHHHDLVDRYGTSVSQMTTEMFHLS